MDAKDERFFKALGVRLAEARNAQGMTQVQLSQALNIAQQTLAHYETGRTRIPIDTLTAMAKMLRFSLDDMLLSRGPRGRSKRGPASKLEMQIEALAKLPRAKQRFIADMLDAILAMENTS